ncbi:MAG TPA: hypothetical protein VD815_01575 [Candidatus Saccharimonadales bacterium]|nr:hypothetical protein [Candidatus Saccharimonadales bacterium]
MVTRYQNNFPLPPAPTTFTYGRIVVITMVLLACPKCGESYSASPPDSVHKKLSKYPDRDTFPHTINCKMCGHVITIYWKPVQ